MPTLDEPTTEESRIYECCVLYPYPLSQKEEQDTLKSIEKHFEEAEGKQIAKDVWGRRGLAYPIKGRNEGTFVIYHYEIDPAKIHELDEALRISPGILRHMLIKPPKGYEILKYSEKYEAWLKEAKDSDTKKVQDEEKELQRKVAERAKRQVKMTEEKKQEEKKPASPMEEKKLTEELDKLISDDQLDI